MRTVLTLFIVAGMMATTGVGHAMTLTEAIGVALTRNPHLMAVGAQGEAARYRAGAALSEFGPKVAISETYVKSDDPLNVFGMKLQRESVTQSDFDPGALNNPEAYENWRTTLSVRQPIFAGGQIYYGFKAARADANAAAQMTEGAKSQLVYRVIEAWMGLWLADRKLEALSSSRELARESMKVAHDREEAGLAHRTDSLDMTINHDRVRQEINVAKAQRQTALERLASLLGLTPEETLKPAYHEYAIPPLAPDMAALVDEAMRQRPDLKRANELADAATFQARATHGAFLPKIGVAYERNLNGAEIGGADGDAWLVAVEAKLNIFSSGGSYSKYKAAKAAAASARWNAQSAYDQARIEIGEAYRGILTARDNLTIALSQIQLTDEAYRISDQQYREGLKSSADLLRAQQQKENAELGGHYAVRELILAQAGLDLATGRIVTSIEEKK